MPRSRGKRKTCASDGRELGDVRRAPTQWGTACDATGWPRLGANSERQRGHEGRRGSSLSGAQRSDGASRSGWGVGGSKVLRTRKWIVRSRMVTRHTTPHHTITPKMPPQKQASMQHIDVTRALCVAAPDASFLLTHSGPPFASSTY